ncbi:MULTISPECIES: response regulator [unclassified Ekhidna]|jgi:two-component system chemotaxis response regulator CheY|uniref:response regulator n=1 Tax=unclassified Ekhidna TaxID=2632188 RepID=UPI0032E02776
MKERLLIVDDSSVMRRTIEKNLADYDLEIIGQAANGVEAVQMVMEQKPDVVTLDITMPEMDGIACLEEIMKINPNTKVMIITALADKLTGLIALDKGARGFMYKPVNADDLAKAFDKLLKRDGE